MKPSSKELGFLFRYGLTHYVSYQKSLTTLRKDATVRETHNSGGNMPVFKETKKPAANPEAEAEAEVKETVETEVKEAPEAEAKETLAVTNVQKLRCKSRAYMVNPFSKDRFFPEEPIDATVDSWLDSQIKAKLIQPC